MMKCQHCHQKDATFYYKQNINGEVTERHLCADCAGELGCLDSVQKNLDTFYHEFFNDGFFSPVPMLTGSFFEPVNCMINHMEHMFALPSVGAAQESKACETGGENRFLSQEDPQALNRERQINALRHDMAKAVEEERFEDAAKIRDTLHDMEKQD